MDIICNRCKKSNWSYEKREDYIRPVCGECGEIDWSLAPRVDGQQSLFL